MCITETDVKENLGNFGQTPTSTKSSSQGHKAPPMILCVYFDAQKQLAISCFEFSKLFTNIHTSDAIIELKLNKKSNLHACIKSELLGA